MAVALVSGQNPEEFSGFESGSRRSDPVANGDLGTASQRDDLLRAVLDSSVDAYWALDSSGHVLEWNKAAVQMFGWTRGEAIGRLLTDLVITPDQQEWVSQDIQNYAEAGHSPVVGQVSAHQLCHKDGTELPVEALVSAVGSGPQLTFHVFVRDMTALSAARVAQYGSEATFEAVFAHAPIGIAVVGLDGSFQRVNQALCDITGYQEHELTELTFQDITYPDDLDTDVGEAARLLRGEISSYQMDKRYYAKDGHLIWVHLAGSIVRDAAGHPMHFIAHIEDISARKRDEELLRRQATRDKLTGVFNRARFEEELARYEALIRRRGYEDEAAVFVIDVDGLKQVNDEGGHAVGDEYLKTIARTISRRLRLVDIFARIGGDEFAVLLPHTSTGQAQTIAQTVNDMVKANTPGSVCIGIAMIAPGQTKDALQRADGAMYQAKQQGRGRVAGPL
ncbi:sensor domain-containing diguanylate cyclase [Mycobacterium paragordonae]|uniref:PAS domain S-box protein n=1 Tax=Mycobacterium paragordonae TaxID=1389713 RepID=A0AAJ1S8A3_9MYCO|nr:sensor domain-containing diguanylate cyclase [Mycobacterium paragordonae]MDP7737337.1 PAS domain S-box protein [Mycobacterium paragordonae]